jgi:3-isopropylmalate/(R)-2-methylmalate dehydratase small subunit
LASQTNTLPDGRKATLPIDGFSKHKLTEGVDELGYTLAKSPDISRFEQSQQFGVSTTT